jgi:hypothetical protein
MVAIGLLKQIKGQRACLPLALRFYLMQKEVEAKRVMACRKGVVVAFETKLDQAARMLKAVFDAFRQPLLVVADSWFDNDGLWSRLERGRGGDFELLSRLRSNLTLYAVLNALAPREQSRRGRPRKYGGRLGSVGRCAQAFKQDALSDRLWLYGKRRALQAFSQAVMLKTMKCPVRVVWVYRRSRYVALATTAICR